MQLPKALQLTSSRRGLWSWGNESGWKIRGAVRRDKRAVPNCADRKDELKIDLSIPRSLIEVQRLNGDLDLDIESDSSYCVREDH